MPDLDIIVSQIPSAVQDNSSDWVMLTQPNAQAETGYSTAKETLENIAKKAVHGIEYETLLANFPSGKRNPTDALNVLNDFIQSQLPVNSSSGSIATFDTSLALPLVECKAQIVAQQAGSGTPSPNNQRAISGFSSAMITRTGKNLVNIENITNEQISSTKWLWDGKLSGNFVISVDKSRITNVTYPDQYFLRIKVNGTTIDIPYDSNGYAFSGELTRIGCYGSLAYARVSGVFSVQLETGSTATTYEAYNGETKTIALGQTVYGGSVDAKSGKLTLTYTEINLDDNSITWDYRSEQKIFRSTAISGIKLPIDPLQVPAWYCEIFSIDSSSHVYNTAESHDNSLCGASSGRLYVSYQTAQGDLTAFKNVISGKKLVYELETPIEITGLTPANFTTIAGEQNIFADCGDVEVSYKQGVQEYIDAKIAETQALIL